MNTWMRGGLYAVVIMAGGVAVALGIITGDVADQIGLIAMGVLGIGGGGTAIKNLRPATTQAVVSGQEVIDALRGAGLIPAGQSSAAPARGQVQNDHGTNLRDDRDQFGNRIPSSLSSRVEQFDQARRRLESTVGEYVGRRRAE